MDWQLGRVDHASLRAYRIDTGIVFLEGMAELPTPGYETAFRPYRMPHAYQFCWREKNETWPDVVTTRIVAARLNSEYGDVITVTDQTGEQLVTVENVQWVASADGELVAPDENRATGTGKNFDFAEALRDAVNNLPPASGDLIKFRIVDVRGTYGGFTGARDVFITIERSLLAAPDGVAVSGSETTARARTPRTR